MANCSPRADGYQSDFLLIFSPPLERINSFDSPAGYRRAPVFIAGKKRGAGGKSPFPARRKSAAVE
jgi:hypothetical protein